MHTHILIPRSNALQSSLSAVSLCGLSDNTRVLTLLSQPNRILRTSLLFQLHLRVEAREASALHHPDPASPIRLPDPTSLKPLDKQRWREALLQLHARPCLVLLIQTPPRLLRQWLVEHQRSDSIAGKPTCMSTSKGPARQDRRCAEDWTKREGRSRSNSRSSPMSPRRSKRRRMHRSCPRRPFVVGVLLTHSNIFQRPALPVLKEAYDRALRRVLRDILPTPRLTTRPRPLPTASLTR